MQRAQKSASVFLGNPFHAIRGEEGKIPIYRDHCIKCGHEAEDIRSVSAPAPLHCGEPMQKVPQAAGSAFVTKAGNWYRRTAASGTVWKGGGRPKPKVIGKGHGLGGRRPPPSIKRAIAEGNPVHGKPLIPQGGK